MKPITARVKKNPTFSICNFDVIRAIFSCKKILIDEGLAVMVDGHYFFFTFDVRQLIFKAFGG